MKTRRPKIVPMLKVILHGSFVVVIWRNFLELLPVNVHHHSYQAGSRNEKCFLKAGRSYQLLGAAPSEQGPSANPNDHIVVPAETMIDRHCDWVYGSIFAPLPAEISPLRGIKKNKTGRFLINAPAGVQDPSSRIASVHVLTYPYCDPKIVGLNSTMPIDSGSPDVVKFHIWAEPDEEIPEADAVMHNRDLMTAFAGVLPRIDLEFNEAYYYKANQEWKVDPDLPGGLKDGDVDAVLSPPHSHAKRRLVARPPAICQSIIVNNYT